MRTRLLFVWLTVAACLIGALAVAGAAGAVGGRPFDVALTGAQEVPGPGDANASGTAHIELNQGQGTVCFDLAWADIDGTVTAAHIHLAPAGAAGGVVVPLFTGESFDGTDATSGCAQNVSEDLIKAIRQNPAAYYVNIHSTVFPAGAVRGQLSE